jgi:hypothetical protein
MATAWGFNPVALAQVLEGQPLPPGDWLAVEPLLLRAFDVTEVRQLFEAHGDGAPRLAALGALTRALREPMAWRDVQDLEIVKQAMQHYRDPDLIRRILPILMPVADAVFTEPDDPAAVQSVPAAGFYGRSMSTFVGDGVSWLDPVQGNAGDCYLITAMIALAWSRPVAWSAQVRGHEEDGTGADRHRIAFYNDAGAVDAVWVGPRLPEVKTVPIYARCTDATEAWAGVVEKAYVMWRVGRTDRDPLPMDYRLISDHRELPHQACRALLGGKAEVRGPYDVEPLATVVKRCDERGVTREPTMAWTWEGAAWQSLDSLKTLGFARTGLVANHAYAVLGVVPAGPEPDYVVVRNPWGSAPYCSEGHALGRWRPGPGANGAAEVELNRNGVFALKAQWFNDCFVKVGWVEP